MAATEDTDALALAYVEGELEPSAARAFEARMAGDPALRAEVDGLRAMKELLAADARFGVESKIDAPPAHLVDAIMRAEAIARPAEIRQAAALAKNPPPSLSARMSRWLLGGGALVASAAALLFVVTRPTLLADMEAAPLAQSVAVADGEHAAKVALAAPGQAASAESPPADALASGAPSKPAAEPPTPDAWRPESRTESKAAPKEEAQREGAAFGDAFGRTAADPSAGVGAGGFAGGRADRSADKAADDIGDGSDMKAVAPAGPPPPPKPVTTAPSADATTRALNEESKKRDQGIASLSVGDEAALQKKPADAPVAQSAGSGVATLDFDDGSKADGAPASPRARPMSAEDARKELYERRVAEKTTRRAKKAESKPAAKDAKGGEKPKLGAVETESAAPLERPSSLKAAQEAELAFTTGLRELQSRRYLEALTAFQSAERLDRGRVLGVSPVIGQMRCFAGLKRTPDVARLGARLLGANITAPDVIDGLLLGADAAEKVGDTLLAEQLWTRLLESPAHKAQAQRALTQRLRPMRNKAALETDAASEAPAAEPPPAASAPAESR